ncbi:MAG: hypothetical protein BM485_16670 [Desulfobulbaceae bacterium DB1]|nr:MAG: hypothetical protein BM485_16670 [Desulfobulbaceae bacterium DB1]
MTNNRHQRADYDSCSADYDKRYAAGPTGVTEILQTLAARTGARTILEAACGTGHWLAQLQGCPQKFGLDLSQGMLRQAGQKGGGLNLVRGDAARMLLRPGGALAVIGMDPHRNRDRWYVYDYFTGTHETGLVRYPSTENLVRVMREEGLEGCTLMQGATLHYDFRGDEVFADPILHKNGVSQLALLPLDEFSEGMKRIRQAIAAAGKKGERIVFPAHITLPAVVGFAPRL